MRAARDYDKRAAELAKINADKEIQLARIRERIQEGRRRTFRYFLLGLAILIVIGAIFTSCSIYQSAEQNKDQKMGTVFVQQGRKWDGYSDECK